VRKAIGATRADILRQFFAESVLLTTVSGVLGLTFGMGACLALAQSSLARLRAPSDHFPYFDHRFNGYAFPDYVYGRNVSGTTRGGYDSCGLAALRMTLL